MIERIPFGKTGHESSRIIFGAAALGAMKQEKADTLLPLLLEYGVNHLDVAAAYGSAEERLAPWLQNHRDDFFLATKTGDRDATGARQSLERSLQRMGVDVVDLVQLHNLVDETEWGTALGPGGALEGLVAAREEGLCRFIGVTGHGTRVAHMHLRSLERFPFDSVLLPYNPAMMAIPEYGADFERLASTCSDRGVALQTIKSIARRHWREEDTTPHFSWYEPLRDPAAIAMIVSWVLACPGAFLNSSSDATLLPAILAAASELPSAPPATEVESLLAAHAVEPLFVPGAPELI